MNRITEVFQSAKGPILNVYTTAGYPNFGDTMQVLEALQAGGVDIIEIGMPYSDPVADGETIQQSNQAALDQGMTVAHLFEQLKDMRQTVTVPVLLMGYINPVLQYGVEAFCRKCSEVGVDAGGGVGAGVGSSFGSGAGLVIAATLLLIGAGVGRGCG